MNTGPRDTFTSILTLALLLSALAATAQQSIGSDYDFLLAISESEEELTESNGTLRIRTVSAHPLPVSRDSGAPGEQLTLVRKIQLATSYRLRGDYERAAGYYEQVLLESDDANHYFFYAQALDKLGEPLRAAYYRARATGQDEGTYAVASNPHITTPTTIYGSVRNRAYGNALPNVEVRLLDLTTDREYVTKTDASGRFRVRAVTAGGEVIVRVTKRFFGEQTVRYRATSDGTAVEIMLSSEKDG